MFIHLHGHSHYSLLEAIGHPKNIVREASDHGMTALALTDYNGLFGAIEFYKACKDAQIKPLLWTEVGFVQDRKTKDKSEQAGTVVLLAKNYAGYQNLLKIMSEANLTGRNNGKARIDIDLLGQYSQDLYLLIWWRQSVAAQMIIRNEEITLIEEIITKLAKTVDKENLIIELLVQDETEFPQIKKVNTALEKIASSQEITLTCANNYHYIDEADQKVSEVALAIKDGNRMFDEQRRKVTMQQHIMSENEIQDIAKNNGRDAQLIKLMINNTQRIADSIDIELPLWQILFPKYESPEQIKDLYDNHKDELIAN